MHTAGEDDRLCGAVSAKAAGGMGALHESFQVGGAMAFELLFCLEAAEGGEVVHAVEMETDVDVSRCCGVCLLQGGRME